MCGSTLKGLLVSYLLLNAPLALLFGFNVIKVSLPQKGKGLAKFDVLQVGSEWQIVLHLVLLGTVVAQIVSNFLICKVSGTDPGIIPARVWNFTHFKNIQFRLPNRYIKAEDNPHGGIEDTHKHPFFLQVNPYMAHPSVYRLSFCPSCGIFKPPRTHHCSKCNNCVRVFDHHCYWLGTCIGKRNFSLYYSLLNWVMATVLGMQAFTGLFVWRRLEYLRGKFDLTYFAAIKHEFTFTSRLEQSQISKWRDHPTLACLVAFIHTLVFGLMVFILCTYHTGHACKNETQHQYTNYRSKITSQFSMGGTRRNWLYRMRSDESRVTRDLTRSDESIRAIMADKSELPVQARLYAEQVCERPVEIADRRIVNMEYNY